MIDILHGIFVGALYLFGTAFFLFLTMVTAIAIAKIWEERK